eukprot:248307-Alexandrium_andersonii.AAC.1
MRRAAKLRAVGGVDPTHGALEVVGGHVGLGVEEGLAVGVPEEDLALAVGVPEEDLVLVVGDIVGDIVGGNMVDNIVVELLVEEL